MIYEKIDLKPHKKNLTIFFGTCTSSKAMKLKEDVLLAVAVMKRLFANGPGITLEPLLTVMLMWY